jgi:hypothetical protein
MGEHDRLVVDYTLLQSSKANLRDIKKALKGIDKHRDDIRDIWGYSSITDKMDEFVDNWDITHELREAGPRSQERDREEARAKRGKLTDGCR